MHSGEREIQNERERGRKRKKTRGVKGIYIYIYIIYRKRERERETGGVREKAMPTLLLVKPKLGMINDQREAERCFKQQTFPKERRRI